MEQPTIPAWRNLGPQDQEDFMEWFRVSMEARNELGEGKYHSLEKGFQGDPFMHLGEELLDAVKYHWIELRRRHSDPFYAIYKALHTLLEKENPQDIEEVLSVNGITLRMNAIRARKSKDEYGAITMNIRLTQIPAPDNPPVGDASMDPSVSEQTTDIRLAGTGPKVEMMPGEVYLNLSVALMEQGSKLYSALRKALQSNGHSQDCKTYGDTLRSPACSLVCKISYEALLAWEEKPESFYKGSEDLTEVFVEAEMEYLRRFIEPRPSEALVKLSQDEADRLDQR